MPQTSNKPAQAAPAKGFDLRTMIELSRHSLLDRVGFAAIYAVLSLFVQPWTVGAGWIAAIVVWEWGVAPQLERASLTMPRDRGFAAYACINLVGASLYSAVALMGLLKGSPIGMAIAVTWITGSLLNAFMYASGNRTILATTLAPMVVVSLFGPWLAFGTAWGALAVPVLLGLSALASQRCSVDHDALLGQLADRQVALADIERKLSIAVEASGDGMFELDLVADQHRPNATWLAMLGYAADEAAPVGGWRALIHPEDLPQVVKSYAAHIRGDTEYAAAEARMRCKDGGYKWVLSRGRLVSKTPDGAPWMLIGTTVDISVRKALEHQLEGARDQAEAASLAKSAFLATMSHEIRTPLNGVLGMAQAMAADQLPAAQRERLDVVRQSGESLLAILNDMLDLSKIEAGKLEIETVEFDLGDISRGAHATFTALANKNGLSFCLDMEGAAGVYLGDPTRTRQVLYNLISNALKFTETGEIRVTMDYDGAHLTTRVTDTGIGMSPEVLTGLFSKFTQADTSTTRRFGGTGLGLSICRELAELMNGSISATSEEGKGSVFVFRIPMIRVGDTRDATADPSAPQEHAALEIRVLAAEDNSVNQLVLKTLLHQVGVAPVVVENGQLAVEAWETGAWDVILMDVQMPVMDGPTAVRAIRAREAAEGRARTPIIALTANAMSHQIAEYLACGMDGYVVKPIEAVKLFETLERVLNGEDSGEATLTG